MKAIQTRYFGPGNVRGSRIKAFDMDGNSVTVTYRSQYTSEKNHERAAEALKTKMEWDGKLACGAIKGGYVFVFLD